MAKVFKPSRVLFFIAGPVPSDEDKELAVEMAKNGADVAFRNAMLVRTDEAVEAFDELAGLVPANYLRAQGLKDEAARLAAAAKFDHDGDGMPGGSRKGSKPAKGDKGKGKGGKDDAADAAAREAALGALAGGGQGDGSQPAAGAQGSADTGQSGPPAAWGAGSAQTPASGQETGQGGEQAPGWKPNA